MERIPKNKAERELYELLTGDGWKISKRGWPDFFCTKGDRVICVEVKPSRGRRLKREQLKVMRYLSSKGVACYRYTPPKWFVRIQSPLDT